MWSGAQVETTPPAGAAASAQAAGTSSRAGRYIGGINAVMTTPESMGLYVDDIARDYPNKRDFAKVAEEVARQITDEAKKRAFLEAASAKVASLPDARPRPAPALQGGARQQSGRTAAAAPGAEGAMPVPVRGSDAPVGSGEVSAEFKELSNRLGELGEEIQGYDLKNDGRALQEADSNFNYARGEENSRRAEARSREDALDAHRKKREEHINSNIKALSDRLGVSEQKLRAVWDMAKFYKDKWDRDLYHSLRQAIVELICENRQAQNEILRVFHAICMKMSDAQLGTRSSASGVFQRQEYFRSQGAVPDQWSGELARANAQQREFNAEAEQLEKIKRETYYDEQVADAERKRAEAHQEHERAASDLKAAEGKKLAESEAYRKHREGKAALVKEYNDLQKRMEELKEQERKKREPA